MENAATNRKRNAIYPGAPSGLTAAASVDAFSDSNVVLAVSFNYAPTHTHIHAHCERKDRQTVGTLGVDIGSVQRPENIFCVLLVKSHCVQSVVWRVRGCFANGVGGRLVGVAVAVAVSASVCPFLMFGE